MKHSFFDSFLRSNTFSWLLRVQFVVLLCTATFLSLVSTKGTPIENLWDKPLHVIGWAGLYISLQMAVRLQAPVIIAAPTLLAYSFLIEVIQAQVGRSFSLLDLVANGCGIALACLAIVILRAVLMSTGASRYLVNKR